VLSKILLSLISTKPGQKAYPGDEDDLQRHPYLTPIADLGLDQQRTTFDMDTAQNYKIQYHQSTNTSVTIVRIFFGQVAFIALPRLSV
jgi:hypothetical protein